MPLPVIASGVGAAANAAFRAELAARLAKIATTIALGVDGANRSLHDGTAGNDVRFVPPSGYAHGIALRETRG